MRTALPILTLLSLAPFAAVALSTVDAGTAAAIHVDAGIADAGIVPPASQIGFPTDAGSPLPPTSILAEPKPLPPIPAGLGRVSGRVTLSGPAPQLRPAMAVGREPPPGTPNPANSTALAPSAGKDIRVCGALQPDLSLQLGFGGGVINTVLWAADGPPPLKSAHPQTRVTIEACRFIPHILVMPVGAELSLVNGDSLYHNVTGSGILSFNYALVLKDHAVPLRIKKTGVLSLESKNHPWMRGFVEVLPTTAWSTTDTDGSYFLDLPPGKHVIKLWHERLGEREETVDIAAGETTLKDFALTPK